MSLQHLPILSCTPSSIPYPNVFGTEILEIYAHPVSNYSRYVSELIYFNHPSAFVSGVDFCNITITYTHPGQNDRINIETWLPTSAWNGNLQAVGGAGFAAGRIPFVSDTAMAGAIGDGYVASTTDAGLSGGEYLPSEDFLLSPGNVDLYALQNLASVSLNDQALIAKALIRSFYGIMPKKSYWSGCSQGGRQGFMLAQRYPDAYDGIAAAAPAINWAEFLPQAAWAQFYMNILGKFPFPCELDAIKAAAIRACDSMDGISDGLVSDPEACHFDPFSTVGESINCTQTGKVMKISHVAALVANATWGGPVTASGQSLWRGPYSQSQIAGSSSVIGSTLDIGYAMTDCSTGTCSGVPLGLGERWLQYFVKKDPSWSFKNITSLDEYAQLFHESVQQFDFILGTNDPDLSAFRRRGGRIITFHGLADGIIPTRGTSDYYDRVTELSPNPHDFFRYFQVTGLGHCAGGNGGQPTATFKALVDWVENGIAPETLPINFVRGNDTVHERILCPYPKSAHLKSELMDATKADSFECR